MTDVSSSFECLTQMKCSHWKSQVMATSFTRSLGIQGESFRLCDLWTFVHQNIRVSELSVPHLDGFIVLDRLLSSS